MEDVVSLSHADVLLTFADSSLRYALTVVRSRMLAKMGFKEGAGLGKHGQGLATPVQAEIRAKRQGLGARPN